MAPGEVDEKLEDEVGTECTVKYGAVRGVMIFEVTQPWFPRSCLSEYSWPSSDMRMPSRYLEGTGEAVMAWCHGAVSDVSRAGECVTSSVHWRSVAVCLGVQSLLTPVLSASGDHCSVAQCNTRSGDILHALHSSHRHCRCTLSCVMP